MGSVDGGHFPPYYSTKFLFKELQRCEIAQGLMGTNSIVYVLPFQESLIKLIRLERRIGNFIKLLGVSSICSFYITVQLG